ncbi:hypothetical protein Ms3S1_30130 [Methylosinus sp. 3S-1]
MAEPLLEMLPTTPACTFKESSKAATEFRQRVCAVAINPELEPLVDAEP